MEVKFFDGGYCTHPEFVAIKGGSFKSKKFPALCVLFVHPEKGRILFDTGYSEKFFEATKHYPYKLYGKSTPAFVNEEDKVSHKVEHVDYVILSHFHADHIGGVLDFDQAKFLYLKHGYDHIKNKSGFAAVRKGYLPQLLPNDFEQRSIYIQEKLNNHFLCSYFENVYDILGDQTLIGVELPGHAKGQLGIYVKTSAQEFFFIADACYLSQTYKKLDFPSPLVNLINDDPRAYRDTIERIHNLYLAKPEIEIIPSHCGDTFKKICSRLSLGFRGA